VAEGGEGEAPAATVAPADAALVWGAGLAAAQARRSMPGRPAGSRCRCSP